MENLSQDKILEKIVSLCKRRGFVFQNSEIYGGVQGFYDYGPLGVEMNITFPLVSVSVGRTTSCQ